MKTAALTIFTAVFLLISSTGYSAAEKDPAATEMGKKLLERFWMAVKNNDMNSIDQILAPGFQSVHQYGSGDRRNELELIKKLHIDSYTLTKIKVTRNGPAIVITYFVSVEETIKGKRLSKTPAPRMTVFVETEAGWQLTAHANLKPMGS